MKYIDPNNKIFRAHGITCDMFHHYYMEQGDLDRFVSFCNEFEITNEDCMKMIQAAYGQEFLAGLFCGDTRR